MAMQAGIAMLKKLKRENPYAKLARKVGKLRAGTGSVAKKSDVHCQSSTFRFDVLDDLRDDPIAGRLRPTPRRIPGDQKERYAKVFHGFSNVASIALPSGYEVSFVSTAHEDAHYEKLISSVWRSDSGEVQMKGKGTITRAPSAVSEFCSARRFSGSRPFARSGRGGEVWS